MNAAEMVTGHSTVDALRILHHELKQRLSQHQNRGGVTSDWIRFLHHANAYSLYHWTSVSFICGCILLLIIACIVDELGNSWLIMEAIILFLLLTVNVCFATWDDWLRRNELFNKASRVLLKIEACIKQGIWCPLNYIDLNCPSSQCVSLQWTIRDSSVINLPVGLLVEGDVILLRPGQVIPAKCQKIKTGDYEDDLANIAEFKAGDFYNPAQNLPELELFSKIEGREPLKPQAFLVLETPFVKNFSQILEKCFLRPVGMLDNERFAAYSIWIERRILPVIVFLMILTNALRYAFLHNEVGTLSDMILVLTVNSVVPLLALVFPIIWRLLDAWGVAKVILTFEEYTQTSRVKKRIPSGGSFKSEASLEGTLDLKLLWKDLFQAWKDVMVGQTDTLARTANLAQVFGNMTSFCCVDKKGLLSWPNPTAEKVFILTSRPPHSHQRPRRHSVKCKVPDGDPVADDLSFHHNKNEHGFPTEVSFQVLDLTQDTKNHYGLRFDDPSWLKYLSSLKPLGLNILLNTCNMETTYKYTEFADHVTCVSLKREEAVPVVNRRCFCELANIIGFSEKASANFTTEQTLGMYRHIPPESTSSERKLESSKSFIKYKMPMPNVFSVVVSDNCTGSRHLFSQGMSDLVLDSCSDFWDGEKIQPLGEAERKKIADFYHRTSMSSYCTAFSYRPLTETFGGEFTDIYLEVPEDVVAFHGPCENKSYGFNQYEKRLLMNDRPYHGSAESLLLEDMVPDVHDIESCFRLQCSQVFIGMITMQYQAKQDIVDLIESLESACIRFVHFSKENELRSRVFSEKMGLEAGWNCHISLASEKALESKVDVSGSVENNREASIGYESQYPSQVLGDEDLIAIKGSSTVLRPSWLRSGRYGSAPEVNTTQSQSIGSPMTPDKAPRLSQDVVNVVLQDCSAEADTLVGEIDRAVAGPTTPLLRHRSSDLAPGSCRQHPSAHATVSLAAKSESRSSLHRTRKRSSVDHRPTSSDQFFEKGVAGGDGDVPESSGLQHDSILVDVPSDTYMLSRASSSDSFGRAVGLNNQAKLPRGIENIRPHIKNVDNVPLQVSLFTDCTAQTTQEMFCILQEFGEVTCCIGSSANLENTGVFLQADCSLAVEPTYPQICIHHSVIEKPSLSSSLTPMELSAELNSIPCSLYFATDDHSVIIHLVALARHHCERIRNVSKLYLMCQLSLVLFQLLNSVFLLPPALPPNVILWLAVVTVPLLSITLMGNPLNRKILQMAQGKNRSHFAKQTLLEELIYFFIRYIPTIVICLFCHGLNLLTFCQTTIDSTENANVTISCHLLFGARLPEDASEPVWNGWYDKHQSGLVLSQQLITFELVLCFVIISLCSIHRLSYLWNTSPFVNRLWCAVTPIVILLQLIFFIGNTSSSSSQAEVAYSLGDIHIAVWVITFVWPLLLVVLHELVKRREIKMWVRHQKRARLDFGTKLGMNSPF